MGSGAISIIRPLPVARAVFDDRNLVSHAGMVPVMRLAEWAGLYRAVAAKVRVPTDKGPIRRGR
jgi:hypothetical protein